MIAAVLAVSAGTAQAGFFDSLFGKEEAAKEVAVPKVEQAATTEAAANTAKSTSMDMGSIVSAASGLLPMLTESLGVTNDQAEGGMGALLGVAKNNLTGDEFGSLSQGIPGAESLLSAAPSIEKTGGMSGLMSNLGAMGKLTQQFEALGLSPDMIIKFSKMAINYFSDDKNIAPNADSNIDYSGLLQKGLGSILG